MRPVAIFRFSPTEGPGHFGEWLERHRVPHRIIALDQGETVPDNARAFAGIGMMGGPMSANDPLSWNAPLLTLLRQAVADDIPVIGHCLGGQLFAKALGASVAPTTTPEIGWGEVRIPDPAGTRVAAVAAAASACRAGPAVWASARSWCWVSSPGSSASVDG
jgi:GMP synthase-like glutamine amidotransferase